MPYFLHVQNAGFMDSQGGGLGRLAAAHAAEALYSLQAPKCAKSRVEYVLFTLHHHVTAAQLVI